MPYLPLIVDMQTVGRVISSILALTPHSTQEKKHITPVVKPSQRGESLLEMGWNKSEKLPTKDGGIHHKNSNIVTIQCTVIEISDDESLPPAKEPPKWRNWGLTFVFTVSAILGFFPISNPLGKTRHLKFRLISIFTLLSAIQLFYPAVVCLNIVVTNAFNPGLSFTARFTEVILSPAYTLGSTVIRINCILSC